MMKMIRNMDKWQLLAEIIGKTWDLESEVYMNYDWSQFYPVVRPQDHAIIDVLDPNQWSPITGFMHGNSIEFNDAFECYFLEGE